LGEFKMGAFHIAMQAGVPVIPIVIANSSDSMPKTGAIIRPAKIDVKVLPPVATNNWTAATVHEHADKIRQLFLKNLNQADDEEVKLRSVK
jgi:putative phosphoserine phosphatase/1-acylglycerol-3-phosphate O-acyltransferase